MPRPADSYGSIHLAARTKPFHVFPGAWLGAQLWEHCSARSVTPGALHNWVYDFWEHSLAESVTLGVLLSWVYNCSV